MKFSRITDVNLIPKTLVEDNKDRSYSVERFYEVLPSLLSANGQPTATEYMYLIIDDESRKIIGYLWYSINILEEDIYINTLSIDKEHRKEGYALHEVFVELKKALENTGFEKVVTCSTRTAWHEKAGFVKSKNVLLEYNLKGEEDGQDSR